MGIFFSLLACFVLAAFAYSFFCWARLKLEPESVKKKRRYVEGNIYYWRHSHYEKAFTPKALGGFTAQYNLFVRLERVDDAQFAQAEMLETSAQDALVQIFNDEVVMPYLQRRACFFALDLFISSCRGMEQYSARSGIYRHDENDGYFPRLVLEREIEKDVKALPPFRKRGCAVTLGSFKKCALDKKLLMENYAMITEEERKVIEVTDEFAIRESNIALAVVKRQLDFLENRRHRHEAVNYFIETEVVGNALKLRWEFKSCMPQGWELLGFRRPGSFYTDQWDDTHNGVLVVHSYKSAETLESLTEKEAHFYTFFCRETKKGGLIQKWDPLRFQVRVPGRDELNELKAIIERAKKPTDDELEKSGIKKSLKALNLAMEFHEELDKMERSFVERIKGQGLSKEEEEEKIEFIRDMVRIQREKYEP